MYTVAAAPSPAPFMCFCAFFVLVQFFSLFLSSLWLSERSAVVGDYFLGCETTVRNLTHFLGIPISFKPQAFHGKDVCARRHHSSYKKLTVNRNNS